MKISKRLRRFTLLLPALMVVNAGYAIGFVGNATPTQYFVTMSKVEFHKVGTPSSKFVTYASGSGQYDIASVTAGSPVGVLSSTGNMAPGSYDQVRVTVSKTMQLQGASNGNLSNGKPCRTMSNSTVVTNPFGDGTVNTAYLGSTDGGTPQLGTTAVPSGSLVTLPSDLTDLGTSFQGTYALSMTVTTSIPKVTMKFDVTNAMAFYPLGANQCVVFPGPPTVIASVG